MKILIMIGALALLSIGISSCKSSKEMKETKLGHYVILVDNEKDAMLLKGNYQDFEIVDLKRISRSQHQYSASFTCKDPDCSALEEKLKSDKTVIKYSINGNHIDAIQTSKGSKAHRTGPIGSRGGQ